jgi:hypothetical protein
VQMARNMYGPAHTLALLAPRSIGNPLIDGSRFLLGRYRGALAVYSQLETMANPTELWVGHVRPAFFPPPSASRPNSASSPALPNRASPRSVVSLLAANGASDLGCGGWQRIYVDRSACLLKMKELAEAEAQADLAVTMNPNVTALTVLVQVRQERGNVRGAIDALTQALRCAVRGRLRRFPPQFPCPCA